MVRLAPNGEWEVDDHRFSMMEECFPTVSHSSRMYASTQMDCRHSLYQTEAANHQLALNRSNKMAADVRYCLFTPQMWRISCCSLSACRLPGEARSPERAGGQEEVLADPVGGGVLSQPQHRPQGPEGGEPVAGRTHEHQDCRYDPVKENSDLTH